MEPEILRRGNEFHRRVQSDWETSAEGKVRREKGIEFGCNTKGSTHLRRGRMDLFVDQLGDFVTVVEIKSTDWDRVKPGNVRKLLLSHSRQVWKYVAEYVDGRGFDVCPGIIYPSAPISLDLKQQVEAFFSDHCIQLVWYNDT